MFRAFLLIALAVAGVCAQQDAVVETAPEPYNYAYDGGSHAAAEQRDPAGKVSGFYTLVDADGRQRRVDYIADEAGFRAKVQTNEMGTKSENSADVEVLAAPPTPEQVRAASVVETTSVQQQAYTVQPQRVVQQVVAAAPAKVATTGVQYVQQPYGYSYYPGSSSYYGSNQLGYTGYGGNYGPGNFGYYGAGNAGYYGAGNTGVYGGYQTVAAPAAASYYRQTVQPTVARYATTTATQVPSAGYRYQSVSVPNTLAYHSTGGVVPAATYSSVPVTTGYRYQTTAAVPAAVGYQTVPAGTVGSTGNLLGSSNYIVLKKRSVA